MKQFSNLSKLSVPQRVQWFKTQKDKKPERILPQSVNKPSMDQFADRPSEKSNVEGLGNLKVAVTGKLKETMVCVHYIVL